jgi:hypothetical protein
MGCPKLPKQDAGGSRAASAGVAWADECGIVKALHGYLETTDSVGIGQIVIECIPFRPGTPPLARHLLRVI